MPAFDLEPERIEIDHVLQAGTATTSLRFEAEDGTRALVHQRLAASRYRWAAYTEVRVSLTAWANQVVRVVIGAGDVGRASLVEVAVDDVRIERR